MADITGTLNGPLLIDPRDPQRHVGTRLGPGAWHVITQDEVDRFASATHDEQWIHQPVALGRPPFGVPVAHGLYLLALVPHLTAGLYTVSGESSAINYRIDRVRFRTPVPIGARIRAGAATLFAVRPRPRGLLEVGTAVTVEATEEERRPTLTAELTLLFSTGPAAPGD
jgi:acyl dehydratase